MTSADPGHPAATEEVLLVADRLLTMDPVDVEAGEEPVGRGPSASPAPQAVLIRDGVIAALGPLAELEPLVSDTAIRREFGARSTIVPGLIDAHAHPLWGLEITRGVNLAGLVRLDDVARHLASAAEGRPEDEWIFGYGLDPAAFPGPIGGGFLDEALGGRAAYVTMFDAHSAVVSSTVLLAAGIEAPRRFPDGAEIVADANGRPSGHLLEFTAMAAVAEVMPVPSLDERVGQLLELLERMAAVGITEIHAMDLRARDAVDILVRAEELAELPVRIRCSPWCLPGDDDERMREIFAKFRRSGRRWRIEGMKFFLDGTIDGGSGWLRRPDAFGGCRHSAWPDRERYAARLAECHASGIPTATHAIGDEAVRVAAETIAALGGGVPHRIEHLEVVDDDVIAMLAEEGITASMQPTHCTLFTDPAGSDMWSRRLGDERTELGWRIGDLVRAGVNVALGSDWPVAPFDPRAIMADAILRRPHDAPDATPVGPRQAIDARTALAGYTIGAARAIGGEHGRIRVGIPADLAVFGDDPTRVAPEELAELKVLATYVGGIPARSDWRARS